MRFLVVATSLPMCVSDALSSVDIETAMNAATVAAVNGGGHWLSSQSRITRNRIGIAVINCGGAVEGTVTAARVYESDIPNNPQLLQAFMGILRDRVSANFVNLGGFNVSVTPFNEYTHGQVSFWQGPHSQTSTRDFFGNFLSDSENPISPQSPGSRPRNITEEARDTLQTAGEAIGGGIGKGIEGTGFSPWMIFGLVGLVAIIAAAPSINASAKAFMESRRLQKESLKLIKNPRKRKTNK